MVKSESWDWETGEKAIPTGPWNDKFRWVEEPYASPDGEKVSAIINLDEGEFSVCVNGEIWENVFDKIWYLRFSPDGRLTALVSEMAEWTVAVDGIAWEKKFGYAWDTAFSPDGKNIAVSVQNDMQYCMALNGVTWENTFSNMTNTALSPDGKRTAATVQTEKFGEAEIHKFQEGAYTAAINGISWD